MANRWGGRQRNELATCTLLKTNRHMKTQQLYVFEILYPITGSKLTVDLEVCLPRCLSAGCRGNAAIEACVTKLEVGCRNTVIKMFCFVLLLTF